MAALSTSDYMYSPCALSLACRTAPSSALPPVAAAPQSYSTTQHNTTQSTPFSSSLLSTGWGEGGGLEQSIHTTYSTRCQKISSDAISTYAISTVCNFDLN